MLRSLRFRLPALFLLGILLSGLVASLIAIRFFQSYTRTRAIAELRSESVGIVSLYARNAANQKVPVAGLEKAIGGDKIFFVPLVRGASLLAGPLPSCPARPSTSPCSSATARRLSTSTSRGSTTPRRRITSRLRRSCGWGRCRRVRSSSRSRPRSSVAAS